MSDQTKEFKIKPVESIPIGPGDPSPFELNVKSYAGLAPAGNGSHLFTWFFGCQKCTDEKDAANYPLLIWLNGGPGGSSMAGAMLENGPCKMGKDNKLVANPSAWNKDVHIMYWDNPVGVGYSFNENEEYVDNEDELSDQFYNALQGFYNAMPSQYRDCPLYVTGESYGGKYIPAITEKILINNDKNREDSNTDLIIKLKGMAIGNPWMDPVKQTKFRLETGFELGFLDTKQYETLMKSYAILPQLIDIKEWKLAFELNQSLKNKLIACGGHIAIYDVRMWDDPSLGAWLDDYFNMDAVIKALHVENKKLYLPDQKLWITADETGPVTEHLIEDFMTNTAAYQGEGYDFSLPKLLDRVDDNGNPTLRVMLYTGTQDMSCGIRGTEYILQNCRWRYQEEWQKLDRLVWGEKIVESKDPITYKYDSKGFIKQYKNLTQVVIPLSGHLVPMNRPEVSLDMINNYVFQREFPAYDPLDDD
ncbi:MAG: S10 family peptidase [bacterium]|nr:S10 family peptidase [bacterium]